MIYRYLSWLMTATLILALYVWQQTQSTRLGFEVDAMRRECERWEQVNKDLRLRINCLISLERLDRVARDKQLISPPPERVVYLHD